MRAKSLRAIAFGVVATALAHGAEAQCLDFADGFGANAYGFASSGCNDVVVFDDGSGPTLYALATINAGTSGHAGLCRWNGAQWSPVGPSLFGLGNRLAIFDDGGGPALYVGGSMTFAGPAPTQRVVRWTGFDFVPVGSSGPDREVRALCVHDDGSGAALYAAGDFANVDGLPATRVARWNGSAWSAVGTGCNAMVQDLVSFEYGTERRLVAAGGFTQAGGSSASRIAQWNGSAWSPLGSGLTGPSAYINDLHVADLGTGPLLYAGGSFTSAGGSPATNIARWNGTSWVGIPSFPSTQVQGIGDGHDASGHALYVGGPASVGALVTNGIARWSGSSWSALGSGTDGAPSRFAMFPFEGVGRPWMFGGIATAAGKPSVGAAVWGVSCTPPTITLDPFDVVATLPGSIVLAATAIGSQPLAYQWRRNGAPVSNGPLVVGATTSRLEIFSWSFDDACQYDCVVTNALGSATTTAANVVVPMCTPNGEPQPLTPRILPGDAVLGGALVDRVSSPVPAADGAIFSGFSANLPGVGLRDVFFEWRNDVLSLAVATGDAAPGFPAGSVLDRADHQPFGSATTQSGGRAAFRAFVQGPGVANANDEGLFHRELGALALIAREGGAAPEISPTAVFHQFPSVPIVLPDGRTVFRAVWRDGAVFGSAVWTWSAIGGTTLVVKSGDPAPGTSGTFSDVGATGDMTPSGGLVLGCAYDAGARSGVWIAESGVITRIATTGDPAPGFTPGSTFVSMSAQGVNANGQLLLLGAVLQGTYHARALYVWNAGVLAPIVVHGQTVGGTGTNDVLAGFEPLGLNDSGAVLFVASLIGPCAECPNRAVFVSDGASLHLVTTNRVSPEHVSPPDTQLIDFDRGAIDVLGRVVLEAQLAPPGSTGVFAWILGSPIFPVAAPGQQIRLPSGVHRTVTGATISGPLMLTNTEGPSTCLRSPSEIVFEAGLRPSDVKGAFRASWDDLTNLYLACPVVSAPASQAAIPGQSAVFTVSASGAAPLEYCWTRDGVDLFDGGTIAGAATPTLSISSVVDTDAGSYAVRVTNPCGSTTSASAVLDVGPGLPYCAGDNRGSHCPCTPSTPGAAVGCLNSLGIGGKLRSSGVASLAADSATLLGSQMPNSSALYFQGTTQTQNGAGQSFGDGLRCAGGAVLRLGTRINAAGASSVPGPGVSALAVLGGLTAPGTRYYQVWYRNAASFCSTATFNLTNGLSIDWQP